MSLWLYFLPLLLLAVAVVSYRMVIPGARDKQDAGNSLDTVNTALYREKLVELDQAVADGVMSEAEQASLVVEFQRQLLEDRSENPAAPLPANRQGRWLVLAICLMLPVLAFVLYDFLGASEQLELREKLEQRARLLREGDSAAAGLLNQDIVKSLQALETRDAENPLYPVLLARLQLETGRVASAVMSYQRAVKLVPEDSVIYGEYAQALFFQENNQATDRVIALAETALSLSPQNHTALELLGIGAFQRENYLAAIDYWQRAMMGLAPGSAARESVEAGVATARAKLTPEQQQHLAAQTVTLDVAVTIVPELATLPPETTVFVYARAWQGSPMPLAIKRLTLAQLPTTVSLTENDAMNPAASLASAEQVELVARVSISGSAVPASGDLMGTRGPIAPRDKNQALTLMIDQRLP